MILFDLKCGQGHVFEAWFKDGETYAAQSRAREISCPRCANTEIGKAPMAPRVHKSRGSETGGIAERTPGMDPATVPATVPGMASGMAPGMAPGMDREVVVRKVLGELRRHVEDNCDNVGANFAEEARKIHYGEADPRGIYGEASEAESSELDDEGVPHRRIPWIQRHDS
ncbi:MAG: DUF1178 family protein [Alphaproteobacteria bacterium]